MITSLSDITLKNFINLLCGEEKVLLQGDEVKSPSELRKTASDLIYEYKSIVNPSGMQAALMDREDYLKIKAKSVLVHALYGMLATGDIQGVKDIFAEIGFTEHGEIADSISRLKAETEYLQKRYEDQHKTEKRGDIDIRKSYDSEIAFLMTYYKMNIDVNVISAGVYANMLRQADAEIKRRQLRR